MSQILSEIKIFRNVLFKNDVKYYHVWYDYLEGHKCAFFVTNDDRVYGIDIIKDVMTPSYERGFKENKYKRYSEESKPIEIKELSDKKIKEFHIGSDFVLALSEDYKLYSWGDNNYGQVGRDIEHFMDINPTEINYFTNLRSRIKQICVYWKTIMVLLDNGKVIVWGRNRFECMSKSMFGLNFTEWFIDYWIIRKPRVFNLLKEIEFIHMNGYGCFAIDKHHNACSWGYNEFGFNKFGNKITGRLGHKKSLTFISKPKLNEIFSELKIIEIKSNNFFTYFLSSDGKLYICGYDCESNESNKQGYDLTQIESNEFFTQLYINKDIAIFGYSSRKIDFLMKTIVINNEEILFELNGKELIETEYKSMEEYCVFNKEFRCKTFVTKLKYSDIRLIDEIGHGNFGKVYQIFFQTKYYAVKKISINEENRNDLNWNNELKIMKKLKSFFVVNLYDYWFEEEEEFEFLYIQMELCDQTLEDILEEKKPSIPIIIDYMIRTEIFRQLLFALNYLHSMTPKVIHRDIKPSNVLIKYHNDHL